MQPVKMNAKKAETYAIQALAWVMSDDEMTENVMAVSGADPTALRDRADAPDVLCSVMDFVLADDKTVIDFARYVGIAPEDVAIIRYSLAGGEHVHWT